MAIRVIAYNDTVHKLVNAGTAPAAQTPMAQVIPPPGHITILQAEGYDAQTGLALAMLLLRRHVLAERLTKEEAARSVTTNTALADIKADHDTRWAE